MVKRLCKAREKLGKERDSERGKEVEREEEEE